jgi:hypothetical protein
VYSFRLILVVVLIVGCSLVSGSFSSLHVGNIAYATSVNVKMASLQKHEITEDCGIIMMEF